MAELASERMLSRAVEIVVICSSALASCAWTITNCCCVAAMIDLHKRCAIPRSTLSVFAGRATTAVRKSAEQTLAEHLLMVLYQGPICH